MNKDWIAKKKIRLTTIVIILQAAIKGLHKIKQLAWATIKNALAQSATVVDHVFRFASLGNLWQFF